MEHRAPMQVHFVGLPTQPPSLMPTLTLDLPPDVNEAQARLLLAIGLFQEALVSVGKAAEIAGLSYRAFLEVLRERGIPAFTITEEDWAQDLAHIRRMDAPENEAA